VIPVHVSGRAADMRSIMRIADERGIAVVEDAAEAFMSKANNRFLGTIGKLGCFSFSPLKVITTGQGGLVVTDDAALHARLREIKDQGRRVRSTGVDMTIAAVGYNFKLTNMQAALGLGQLDSLEWRLTQMRRLYRGYAKGLAGINQIALPGFKVEEGELPLWTDALAERRDALDGFLKRRGIDCRTFWRPIHTQPAYRASDSNFPHAVASMEKAIWLPAAFSLTDSDVARVCESIAEFYDGAAD
jgi:perosamine synthetase